MEEAVIFLFGTGLSCIIGSILIFQFMKDSYLKKYESTLLYGLLPLGTSVVMVVVNILRNPLINMLGWVIVCGIAAIALYENPPKTRLKKILEIVVLVFILTVCEGIGYFILEFVMWKSNMQFANSMIAECLKITFSKLSVLVLYYAIMVKIWKGKGKRQKLTAEQYVVYGIIIVYTILNVSLLFIAVSGSDKVSSGERVLLLINMVGIVFIDLFFLYFTKFSEENTKLKVELNLLEQQADLQYDYYVSQEEKYKESISILHDVNKHLNMIEEIYQAEKTGVTREYTKEIQELLRPLLPQQYTNNTILNILLNEKKRSAALNDICFTMEIYDVNLEFIKPIEITTIFGNLLDNAIEACKRVSKDRYIDLKLDSYNEFVNIRIVNSAISNNKWVNGRPVSDKGKNHGIGLVNVENIIKKYNGDIALKNEEGVFECSIILNG